MNPNKQRHCIANYLLMFFSLMISMIAIGNAVTFLILPPSKHSEIMGLDATKLFLAGVGGEMILSCVVSVTLILCNAKKWLKRDFYKKIVVIIAVLCCFPEALLLFLNFEGAYNYSKEHLVFLCLLLVYLLPVVGGYLLKSSNSQVQK